MDDVSVDVREPDRQRRGRVVNAGADAAWDLWQCARSGPQDVHVSPCNIGAARRRTPHLLVAYDTMLFDHPELFDSGFVRYSKLLVPLSLRRADLVLTMSERSRRRLTELSGGKARVEVLPWRGRGQVREPQWPSELRVLLLGATEPHKRQALGVEAVHELRTRSGAPVLLDVVGPRGRAEADVASALLRHDPQGVWTRRLTDVPDAELRSIVDASWLLLQPSRDEGFGLPLLEATERGVAVVHSGAGAMSEVLQSGAAADDSAEELATAMAGLLDESSWLAAIRAARTDTSRNTVSSFNAAVARAVQSL